MQACQALPQCRFESLSQHSPASWNLRVPSLVPWTGLVIMRLNSRAKFTQTAAAVVCRAVWNGAMLPCWMERPSWRYGHVVQRRKALALQFCTHLAVSVASASLVQQLCHDFYLEEPSGIKQDVRQDCEHVAWAWAVSASK